MSHRPITVAYTDATFLEHVDIRRPYSILSSAHLKDSVYTYMFSLHLLYGDWGRARCAVGTQEYDIMVDIGWGGQVPFPNGVATSYPELIPALMLRFLQDTGASEWDDDKAAEYMRENLPSFYREVMDEKQREQENKG